MSEGEGEVSEGEVSEHEVRKSAGRVQVRVRVK